tara:strand:+ start:109 stop:738 length:630 start_codon:yes stop_codon:yes gene_type:complete
MAFIIDGTTGIATVDGSVSAPSQRGQDSNSGISYAADTIKFSTNGVERMAITNSGITGITQGKLLQVVSHLKTGGNFTTTSTSNVDVTGMSKDITPTAASSKIKVTMSFDADIDNSTNNTSVAFFIIDRQVASGSFSEIAGIALGGNSIGTGNFYNSTAIIYLDSPSYTLGNAITYKMKTLLLSSGATISVSQSNYPRTSSIILEEIAA